jgi:hypothetical protein
MPVTLAEPGLHLRAELLTAPARGASSRPVDTSTGHNPATILEQALVQMNDGRGFVVTSGQ